MFFVTIGFRFFIDLGHDGVQAFRPASHDQVAHQGFQGRAVVVLGDGGALRRQGIGIAGPLADGLFVVRQAVVDAAVDIAWALADTNSAASVCRTWTWGMPVSTRRRRRVRA